VAPILPLLIRGNSRDSRAQNLVFICVYSWFAALKKISKKLRKKACQPLASSAKREIRTTNSPVWPFKKSLKKVKKKLVRPLEI
jgi:hypothetical protein